jgi:hypothetical protein
MHLHLTYIEFLFAAIALVTAAFLGGLVLAASIHRRRNRKALFLNYFNSHFDEDQFDQDPPRRHTVFVRNQWRA